MHIGRTWPEDPLRSEIRRSSAHNHLRQLAQPIVMSNEPAYPHHSREQKRREHEAIYGTKRAPPRPKTRTDLDVLIEKHRHACSCSTELAHRGLRFIRAEQEAKGGMSWEDELACATARPSDAYPHNVNQGKMVLEALPRIRRVCPYPTQASHLTSRSIDLKHYKSGQIAMRWRTEDEVLAESGERTCGNLRCVDHTPAAEDEMARWRRKRAPRERSPPSTSEGSRSRRRSTDEDQRRRREPEDEDDEEPLVPTDLTAYQRSVFATVSCILTFSNQ
jgi:hypothetical protein